jgi:hypothetical protein
MDDDVSLVSMHPFIQGFVFSILRTIKDKSYAEEGRVVVDADLVPGVSKDVMMASMGTNVVEYVADKAEPSPAVARRDMSGLVAPIRGAGRGEGGMMQSLDVRKPIPARRMRAPQGAPTGFGQKFVAPVIAVSGDIDKNNEYGKISPLLNDPSLSIIECLGKGKDLMIVRAGQKQRTRINLNEKDILGILGKVAEKSHIPMVEGVFRASVEGFSISAVISELVGSRFVIKKATAYGMIE